MRRKKLANKIMSILMSATMLISTPISALATDVEVRQNVYQGEVQISSEGVEDLSESDDLTEENVEEVQDEDISTDEELISDETGEYDSDPEEEVIIGDSEEAEPIMTLADEGGEAADVTSVSAKVSYAAQADGAFLMAPQMDANVSSDLAESYGLYGRGAGK